MAVISVSSIKNGGFVLLNMSGEPGDDELFRVDNKLKRETAAYLTLSKLDLRSGKYKRFIEKVRASDFLARYKMQGKALTRIEEQFARQTLLQTYKQKQEAAND